MNIEIKKSNKLIPYKFAIKILEKRVNDIKRGKKNELLWILEHPLTYTAGVRYKNNEILDKKIRLIKTKRGGKITLHNPGQKIIYFAIDLSKSCSFLAGLSSNSYIIPKSTNKCNFKG